MHLIRSQTAISILLSFQAVNGAFAAETPSSSTTSAPTSPAAVPADEKAKSTVATENSSDGTTKKASPAYQISLNHYLGFRSEVDPFSVVTLSTRREVGSYRFAALQNITKLYFVPENGSEVLPADTVLSVSRRLNSQFFGFEGRLNASLTLPISEFSREQKIISKPQAGVSYSRSFLDDTLRYSIGAGAAYYLETYKTTRTGAGSGGGRPLREFSWSVDQSLSYSIYDKLSGEGSVTYTKVRYHDVGYRNRVSFASSDVFLNTNYSINLGLAYDVREDLVATLGYSQSDFMEKAGGIVETYFFDAYTSQWVIGLSTSF